MTFSNILSDVVSAPVLALTVVVLLTWFIVSRPQRVKNCGDAMIVVSGCDTGFGRAAIEELGSLGFSVVALCLTDRGVAETGALQNVTALQCDVSSQADCDKVCTRIRELAEANHGGTIHALVNNAGIMLGSNFDFSTVEEYEKVMQVNFFGAVRLAKGLLPLLKRRGVTVGGAKIINVTSLAGLVTAPGMSTYTASKHAIQAWSDAIALELRGFGISVASVNPTFFRTNIVTASGPRLSRTWAALPENIKAQYGDSTVERSMALIRHISSSAGDPSAVVRVLVDLATRASAIAPRHRVGADFAMLTSFLPHAFRHWVIATVAPGPEHPELAAARP